MPERKGFGFYLERDFGSTETAADIHDRKFPQHLPSRIPSDLLQAYEDSLDRIIRWKEYGLSEGRVETDLDHTLSIISWLDIVEGTCPALRTELNFRFTRVIAAIHDSGELITGDPSVEDQRVLGPEGTRKWKEKEGRAATLILFPMIPDKEVGKWLTDLYRAYEKPDLNRLYIREALFAKLADKIQGEGMALRYGHPPERLSEVNSIVNIYEHVLMNLRKMRTVLEALIPLLSTKAQIEVGNIALNLFTRYEEGGFQEEARQASAEIRRVMPTREVPRRLGRRARQHPKKLHLGRS